METLFLEYNLFYHFQILGSRGLRMISSLAENAKNVDYDSYINPV